jgi:hypothetical protein
VNPQPLNTFPAVLFRVLCLDVLVVYLYDTFLVLTLLYTLLSIFLFFFLSFLCSPARNLSTVSGSVQREFNPVEVVETNVQASRQSKHPLIYHCMHLCMYQLIEAGGRVDLVQCYSESRARFLCVHFGPIASLINYRASTKTTFVHLTSIFCGSGNPGQIPMGHKYGKYGPPYYSSVSTQISDAGNFFFIPDPLG